MIRRSTWVLLVILAILVVFSTIYQRNQNKKVDSTITATPKVSKPQLLDLESTQVSAVDITSSSGSMIKLYRDLETDKWAIRDFPLEQVDSLQIETNIEQLLSAQLIETLTQPPPLDSIALLVPSLTITIGRQGGSDVVVYVGALTPIGSGYYVRVGKGPVSIVEKSGMESAVAMLSTPPLLPTPTGISPTQAETPGQTIPPTNFMETATPAP